MDKIKDPKMLNILSSLLENEETLNNQRNDLSTAATATANTTANNDSFTSRFVNNFNRSNKQKALIVGKT